jgi:hypothetical protein
MTTIKVKNNSFKIVHIPAHFCLNYALNNDQAFQYCFFKGKDIEKYIIEECDTVCECEDDVYDATNTGFKSTRSYELGFETHPFLKVDGVDLYVRCDSHFKKDFV